MFGCCVIGEGHDFECPYCGQGLEVQEWTTEYGDPLSGENHVMCCSCRREFNLYVVREITYKVSGDE